MNKFNFVLILVLGILLTLGLMLWGIPVSKTYSVGSCSAKYQKYLIPKTLCQYLTGGHCFSTDFNKSAAVNEVGRCLCENFKKGLNNGENIMKVCSISGSCSRISEGLNADVICSEPEDHFQYLVID